MDVPEEQKEIVKAKNVVMVSIPHILPIVTGNSISEEKVDKVMTYNKEIIKQSTGPIYFSGSIWD